MIHVIEPAIFIEQPFCKYSMYSTGVLVILVSQILHKQHFTFYNYQILRSLLIVFKSQMSILAKIYTIRNHHTISTIIYQIDYNINYFLSKNNEISINMNIKSSYTKE